MAKCHKAYCLLSLLSLWFELKLVPKGKHLIHHLYLDKYLI